MIIHSRLYIVMLTISNAVKGVLNLGSQYPYVPHKVILK